MSYKINCNYSEIGKSLRIDATLDGLYEKKSTNQNSVLNTVNLVTL